MKNKSIILILFVICMFMQNILHAQQWQWAKKGGSVVDVCDGCVGNNQEEIKRMYTDKDGNTYTYGVMGWQGKFDTFTPQANLLIGSNDQMYFLAKTNCGGKVEWVKYFGGGAFSSINMADMLIDEELDRIYLTFSASQKLIVSNDTTYNISPGGDPTGLLIFNLSGQRIDLRILTRAWYQCQLYNLKMDERKNIYSLMISDFDTIEVFPGIKISPMRFYVFKFDRNFNYISHFDMKIDSASIMNGAGVYYQVVGNKYLGVFGAYDTIKIGDSTINVRTPNGISVLTVYDSLGNIIALTHSLPNSNPSVYSFGILTGPNDLNIVGDTLFANIGAINSRFNQDTFINILPNGVTRGVLKLSINNIYHNISSVYGKSLRPMGSGGYMSLLTNDKYYVPIQVWDSCWYGTYKIKPNPYRVMDYIAVLDHNLNFIDTIKINIEHALTSSPCIVTNLSVDKNDNLYIAGIYNSPFFLPSDTIPTIGGVKDIYLAKYGAVSCTPCIPLGAWIDSSYNFQLYCSNQSEFVDSIYWNFGDGTSSSALNANHTYTASGIYTVCMYAFGSCGIDTVCKSIGITGISSASNELPLLVYPNPANDKITIQYSTKDDVSIEILDLQGKTVYSSIQASGINQKINLDISKLSNGLYTILVKDTTSQGVRKLSVVR